MPDETERVPEKHRTVQNIIREKENSIRRQPFESAFLYNAQGILILSKAGVQYTVEFTREETSLMKGAILTHNHPRGLEYPDSDIRSWGNSFSDSDIALASTHELAEIRVVTPKQRFSMKPPAEGWSLSYWEDTLKPTLDEVEVWVYDEFDARIAQKRLTPTEAQALHWHEVWLQVARRLGLEYAQEED